MLFRSNDVLPVEILSIESKQGEKEHVRLVTRKGILAPKKGPECGNDHSNESTSNSMRAKISTPSITPLCTIVTPQERTITICGMPSIHSRHGKASCKAQNGGCSHIERKSCHAFNFIHKYFALEATKWIREVFTMFDRAWYSTK